MEPVFDVEFLLLLLEDADEDWCRAPFVVADVELEDDFELFKLPDEEEVCWCCNCCLHFARRFLNQTWMEEKMERVG